MAQYAPYHELHRPHFHFTARKDWMNDPNGLVYYKGVYHLFFQHTPGSLRHGPNTWGHAVSSDLVHWKQIAEAIEPDDYGWIWSGSGVVDWGNTAGFQQGEEPALVAIYTTGGYGNPRNPCVQALAYSNNAGLTWTKYEGNPVIGHICGDNRDPKVIWHEPTGKWVMALYLDQSDYALFASRDLRSWEHLQDLTLPGLSECPDFFPLPLDADPADTKWVYWGAQGAYVIGAFDGRTFSPETDVLWCERGGNGYAAQTWSNIPPTDGRRIQISWMAGGHYPSMPFNQQLSFPVELTLRTLPEGIRLCREPVREIALLHDVRHQWKDYTLEPGRNLIPPTRHDLFHIRVEVELRGARGFGLIVRGHDLRYEAAEAELTFLRPEIPLPSRDGRVSLELLVDRTSLEVFGNDGEVSASFCFLPQAWDHPLEFHSTGGTVVLVSLTVRELTSAWAA